MAIEKWTIAEKWLEKIDRPWMSGKTPSDRVAAGIDRRAVRSMKDAAENVLQSASPRYTDIFVFADGTGVYEKRQDDWFVMDAAAVREHGGESDDDEVEDDEVIEAN
jgi:hypothetical protein